MPNRNDLLDMDDDALLCHCRQETYRASGPGGQHRNKTDSAVRLSILGGLVVAQCADHRSQHRNRKDALARLRSSLAIDLRMPIDAQSETQHWHGSWALGKKDRRYAAFLGHVLDVLSYHDWAVGLAAEALGLSTGKLIRTLARDPHAWAAVNQERAKLDLINLRRP
ncbi:peptide chain release factor family protein [Robiginitomaculum antarcticum]|uniref:peptide chain release factor family protein n=1 Tax=Robiginitomaculum antarcticum TaxID=437507 RepID=UPI0006860D7F